LVSCDLIYTILSISDCIMLIADWLVNDKLERIWMDAIVA